MRGEAFSVATISRRRTPDGDGALNAATYLHRICLPPKRHEAKTVSTFTNSEFDRDTSSARKAAVNGPVFITDGGQPTHVLLTIGYYLRLTDARSNLAEALAQPDTDFDFEPGRMGTPAEFLLASPLCGTDLDIARKHDTPRDVEP